MSRRKYRPIVYGFKSFQLKKNKEESSYIFNKQNWACMVNFNLHTLVYRIDVQEGKFLKNIKRAGHNRRAGGKFS